MKTFSILLFGLLFVQNIATAARPGAFNNQLLALYGIFIASIVIYFTIKKIITYLKLFFYEKEIE